MNDGCTYLVSEFARVDAAEYADIHRLQNEREQSLWVMATSKNEVGIDFVTPAEISDVLRDRYHIAVPRQRISALLHKEKGTVARRRTNGKQYFIMRKGEDEISSSMIAPIFIEPEAALSQIRKVEDVLGTLKGSLRICDPYVDNRTIDLLAECGAAEDIKLLTVNVHKEGPFRRDLAAFAREHGDILETRVLEQGNLHDRYIIHSDGMLLLGTSLNGLGKKQSFIVSVGEDLRQMASPAFDRSWASAKKFG
jgi:hypothetical protein